MPSLKKQKSIYAAGTAALLSILMMAFMSCKSPSSPEEEQQAFINVYNTCGADVDIFVDEVYKKSLENDSDTTFTVLSEGKYLLEAYKTGTEKFVGYGEVQVFFGGKYRWDIVGPSTIVVTNNYGETLQIHVNGTYLGDLDDSYSEEISGVTFGEHTIDAKKPTSSEVVDSITFEVIEVGDYFWEITKEE